MLSNIPETSDRFNKPRRLKHYKLNICQLDTLVIDFQTVNVMLYIPEMVFENY